MGSGVEERVQFGVLGPLEVVRNGVPTRLGGERQRTLLGLLVVDANRLVRMDRLVDVLVGEQRAGGAVNAVRVAVSRLRAVIEPGDPGRIVVTKPGGYVLKADVEQLDVARFERLLGEARGHVAGGDAAGSVVLLREALGLWRGEPLADVAQLECFQGEIRRLEELRLLALMERIDADLMLGGAGELIAEIETLIAAHPLQERLRGQLMLALYRAGRQSDALAVYQGARRLLRDQLGLEPGRDLRERQRLILNQDPVLDPPPRAVSPPRIALPAPATAFLGRRRELEEVHALLRRRDTRLLTLTGAGGSGKTRLAVEVAATRAPDYRDGVWFVGFADITDPELISSTICVALHLAERPDLTPRQRLHEWLADRELLLVLDNLEQLTAGTAILGELLAAAAGLTVLATSREPLGLAGEQQYDVPVLTPQDAIVLFTTRARAVAPGVSVDSTIAAALCERLDCLPLAIELAAARTKALAPAEILGRLESRLDVLGSGPRDAPRRQRTLQATITWSFELLSDEQQLVFARLAVFTGGCMLPAAEAVCHATLDGLHALIDRSLLRTDGRRYWMLQTIHQYAHDRLQQTGEADDLRGRHAQWCVDLLSAEATGSEGFGLAAHQTALLAEELDNFRSALEWAAMNSDSETVSRLAAPLTWSVWGRHGQLAEAQRWLDIALEHLEEQPARLQAEVLGSARDLAWRRGDWDRAAVFCERALAIDRATGNLRGICRNLMHRGTLAGERGDSAADRAAVEEAIGFARAHGFAAFLPNALINLGDTAIAEGNLDEAQRLCEEGLALAAGRSGGSDVMFAGLINLAHIANLQDRHDDGLDLGRQALAAALGAEAHLVAASTAMEIAWSLAELGRAERAARLLGAGIGFIEDAGAGKQRTDQVCEAAVRVALGRELDGEAVGRLLAEGRRVPFEEAVRHELPGSG